MLHLDGWTEGRLFQKAEPTRTLVYDRRTHHPVEFPLETIMLQVQPKMFLSLPLNLRKEILRGVDVTDV